MKTLQFASALVVAVSAAAFVTTSVQAAFVTYDFIKYIDGSDDGTQVGVGEHALTAEFTIQGNNSSEELKITATGSNFNASTGTIGVAPYAYFDSNYVGLGVCQALSGTQCLDRSDDNITNRPDGNGGTNREVLSLAFANGTQISKILFRDEGHTPQFSPNLASDGRERRVYIAVSDGASNFTTPGFAEFDSYVLQTQGIKFNGNDLLEDGDSIGALLLNMPLMTITQGLFLHIMYDNQQVYLSGLETYPVPIPAALPLFGSGLALMGFVGWRKKRLAKPELAA